MVATLTLDFHGNGNERHVIDYDALGVLPPEVVYDLPAGGRRLIQRTKGYCATVVSGVPVYRDGESTGAYPGRLVRG